MRIVLLMSLSVGILSFSGCAAVAEPFLNNAFFDSDIRSPPRSDDHEIDHEILERKGIAPGSKEHRRLEYHESFQKESLRKFRENDTRAKIPDDPLF